MSESLPVPGKAKRGNKHYFQGFKFAFLNLLAIEYHRYKAEGRPGAFYDYVTYRFFNKFGFTKTGDFNIEPLEDPAEERVDDDDDENGGCTTEAEANEYRARSKLLQDVSIRTRDINKNSCYWPAETCKLVQAAPQIPNYRLYTGGRENFNCRAT